MTKQYVIAYVRLLSESSVYTCHICKNYKKIYLYSKLRSIKICLDMQMEAGCEVDSHVNYRFLDTPQKLQKLRNMHAVIVKQKDRKAISLKWR